jgi:hypothetical protein
MIIIIIIIIITNNRGNWNHHQTIQKIPQQHAGKAGNQGTTKNSHTGHCAQTSESTDVKVPNLQRGKNITYSINCNYNIVTTIYTAETWFVSGI